ncbi:hypothetical protein [Gellertiella hungarica]|uniref:Uncharacterized protein n=1 Tax=Gellertiella hungarica TaxID=1572859 RepID=A0A7W6J5F0_9HYPH|nr:hypothetical protein [Gellertiella hungarica]MBB4064248.1 hypothetical protein [Gellertiella hungarica]
MTKTIKTKLASAANRSATSSFALAAGLGGSSLGFRRDATHGSVEAVETADASAPAYPYSVCYAELEAELDALIDQAIAAIVEGDIVEDDILGHYVHIASLVRAVSFREGKLLELAIELISRVRPDLVVLTKSLRLPLVKAALEAVANNNWANLDGVLLDCEAPAKGTYTPDVIIVDLTRRLGYILDVKRSLASYGDTSRLEELKAKMMASALVLPDWLYKHHKRLMIDTVGVAILDGASRPSDHENGVWALDELDDLLGISGAAATMAELRRRLAARVQQVLERETRKALGIKSASAQVDAGGTELSVKRQLNFNAVASLHEGDPQHWSEYGDDDGLEQEPADEEDEPMHVHPVRLKVGFARSLRLN